MTATASVLRAGEAETLHVLGVDLQFLCRREDTNGAWSMMNTTIPKGAGPPAHWHPWDEAYLVLDGEVEFEIEGTRILVRRGDFVYAPGHAVHAFHAVSDEPARMIIVDAPAHAEAFFRDVDREVRTQADLARVPAIGERHDLHFLPM